MVTGLGCSSKLIIHRRRKVLGLPLIHDVVVDDRVAVVHGCRQAFHFLTVDCYAVQLPASVCLCGHAAGAQRIRLQYLDRCIQVDVVTGLDFFTKPIIHRRRKVLGLPLIHDVVVDDRVAVVHGCRQAFHFLTVDCYAVQLPASVCLCGHAAGAQRIRLQYLDRCIQVDVVTGLDLFTKPIIHRRRKVLGLILIHYKLGIIGSPIYPYIIRFLCRYKHLTAYYFLCTGKIIIPTIKFISFISHCPRALCLSRCRC